MPELAYVAIETAGGPHVTPVLHARAEDRLWFMVGRGTLKARVLAKRPAVGVLLDDAVISGEAQLVGAERPIELARAVPALGLQNQGELLGFARAAAFAPSRVLPSNLVLVSVELHRIEAVEWPEGDGLRGPVHLDGVPRDLRALPRKPGPAVLGWQTPEGPIAVPAHWDPSSGRAQVAWPPLSGALALREGPACLTFDESIGCGPGAKRGVMLRGRGSLGADGSVKIQPERVSWWNGFETGTVPAPPRARGSHRKPRATRTRR